MESNDNEIKTIIMNSTNLIPDIIDICLEYIKIEMCAMCIKEISVAKLNGHHFCNNCLKYRIMAYSRRK